LLEGEKERENYINIPLLITTNLHARKSR